jgi:hypothetical protein
MGSRDERVVEGLLGWLVGGYLRCSRCRLYLRGAVMGQLLCHPSRYDPLLTRPRLSAFWGVSPRTLARYEKDGMPSEKQDGEVRYRFSKVQAWKQRRERMAS